MNIIKTILKNKERIEYKGYYTDDDSYAGYDLFKFYFDKRNIFGFRKYINIICYDNLEHYKPNHILDIRIEIPTWNIFKYNDFIDVKDKELSEELFNVYNKYQQQDKQNAINNISKILEENLVDKK